ncbi:MAG: glycine--tRNA ligase subunit beta [Rhodospirillales bacterium]|nr:glycine--tRNA ligase subunit beta [Rhodospirillales bacterium]
MAELLLELLSEEIPARMQARAADDLKRLVSDGLKASGLDFKDARAFATPRRLALVVDGLPTARADVSEERRGPRVGAPEQAVQGFLKATGLASLDQAEKRDTGKGEFWFAVLAKKGGPTAEALPGIIDTAMKALPWPKSMKWGSGTMTWVRPLQSIVALFDGKVLAGEVAPGGEMAPIRFGDTTRGHRFLSEGAIKVSGFEDYVTRLRDAFVILDPAERDGLIRDEAAKLCASDNIGLIHDVTLRTEVAGLVEWPVPLLGTIDPAFMDLPREVLIVSMRTHQRYFATHSFETGELANRFVVVANIAAPDDGRAIVDGNERVLRARLADAKFFWDQDRKTTLEARASTLGTIIFHARLGTQAQRVDRIVALSQRLSNYLPGADSSLLVQAGRLCKADLVSDMVGEFPELQGAMGRYYALHDGLPESVANAIADHYSPVGPSDQCPTAPISVVIALADKLDTLVSFWSIGEKPTGSRDPFALRRSALGVIRLIIENGLRIPLRGILANAMVFSLIHANIAEQERVKSSAEHDVYKKPAVAPVAFAQLGLDAERLGRIARGQEKLRSDEESTVAELIGFLTDRLKVQMREKGVRHDIVDAVFARSGEDDLVRLLARVNAVQRFLGDDAGKNLLAAYGRAANIVRAEERKDSSLRARISGAVDATLLEQREEKAVAMALYAAEASVRTALENEDFASAMTAVAELRTPIDFFFEKVTVNVADKPDLRLNRLKLLNQIRTTMDSVADFSRIEG